MVGLAHITSCLAFSAAAELNFCYPPNFESATVLAGRTTQTQQEAGILRVCQNKVRHRSLPMKIVDAEYQFDMHKLTLFFEAER